MSEAPKGEQSGRVLQLPDQVHGLLAALHRPLLVPGLARKGAGGRQDGRSGSAGGYCPECGTHGAKMLFTEETVESDFIFEIVGHTTLLEMTPRVQDGVGHGAPTVKRMEEGA